jgi:hypothetical protein
MPGSRVGVPGCTAPGDPSPAPGSLGAVGPGVSDLLLLGSLGLPPSCIEWRRVEGDAELGYSPVADVEKLLHDTLASISQNILRPLWVSLKKVKKVCLCTPGSLRVPSLPPIFASATFVTG